MTSWLALDFIPIERDIRGEATKEPINAGFRQHQARAKREVSFLNPFLCRCGLAGKLGRRRALFEHRSSLRSVQAVQGELHSRPICLSIRRNPAGAAQQGGVSWVTFFSRIKKVTCRRAAPANIHVYRTYDPLNRLTGESGPAKTQTITYDENGNRLSDGAGSYTYETGSNRMLTRRGLPVTTDAAGNITADGTGREYVFNQARQLAQVKQNGILIATYIYNYRGLRTRKITTASALQGAQTIVFHYDPDGKLIAETSGSGLPLRTYIWRDDTPVAQIEHQPSRKIYYFETDHLNTPRAMTDETGKVVWRWESDSFGSTLPNEDADGDGVKMASNLRFPGQYYDKETGLHYNWHRYYDPTIGQYIQADPIGLEAGTNLYQYVNSNPLNYVDPAGLETYTINRDLSAFGDSARSRDNPFTHTFTATTNPDGTIDHTYSWGNDANLNGWNIDQPLDIKTAKEALKEKLAEKVGGADLDPFVKKAFDELNKPKNEHTNGVVYGNCKTETTKLQKRAKELQRSIIRKRISKASLAPR